MWTHWKWNLDNLRRDFNRFHRKPTGGRVAASAEYAWFMLLFLRLCLSMFILYIISIVYIRILCYCKMYLVFTGLPWLSVIYVCVFFVAHRMPRDCWAPAEWGDWDLPLPLPNALAGNLESWNHLEPAKSPRVKLLRLSKSLFLSFLCGLCAALVVRVHKFNLVFLLKLQAFLSVLQNNFSRTE